MSYAAMAQTLGAAVFLALIHVLTSRFHPERVLARRYWLPFADGISISYVCLQLFPEIVEGAGHFPESFGAASRFLEHSPFFPLLMGLVVFSGLGRLIEPRPAFPSQEQAGEAIGLRVWSHIASYGLYKGLIGYLLAQTADITAILVFTVSMAMHFLVVDSRLLEIHKGVYQRFGRWLLSIAILVGWVIGATTVVSSAIVSLLLAFVAGGIVLIVLEEEFAKDHPGSFVAFLTAVILYSALQWAL